MLTNAMPSPRTIRVMLAALGLMLGAIPGQVSAQPTCAGPELTQAQLQEIVRKAREARADLPPLPAEHTVDVQRKGCHYQYIEYPLPRVPDSLTIFTINPKGVLVNLQPKAMACPARELSEDEIAKIVAEARVLRADLPRPLASGSRTSMARQGCMYLYFEYGSSGRAGDFQVITVDPLGEVVDGYRNR